MARLVGNAVPPQLAKSLALSIKDELSLQEPKFGSFQRPKPSRRLAEDIYDRYGFELLKRKRPNEMIHK